jgi:hypothetical protein
MDKLPIDFGNINAAEIGNLAIWQVLNVNVLCNYSGRFIMFSVITNIYNKKTEGPTLMELFTATGKLIFFFLHLEMFDVCTTGDTAHIDTIFKFLPSHHCHVTSLT